MPLQGTLQGSYRVAAHGGLPCSDRTFPNDASGRAAAATRCRPRGSPRSRASNAPVLVRTRPLAAAEIPIPAWGGYPVATL